VSCTTRVRQWLYTKIAALLTALLDCGVTHVTEQELRDYAKSKNPASAADVDKIEFRLWEKEQLEESVKEDVSILRAEKSLTGLEVYGFVLDTQTGVLKEVAV
jgi:carbonic anhydrase